MTERTSDMDTDLRGRVVILEHASGAKDQRIAALEQWRTATDLAAARKDEQFTAIKEDIKSIKGTMSRIMWLIITAIVFAVMAFMVSGGFKVP